MTENLKRFPTFEIVCILFVAACCGIFLVMSARRPKSPPSPSETLETSEPNVKSASAYPSHNVPSSNKVAPVPSADGRRLAARIEEAEKSFQCKTMAKRLVAESQSVYQALVALTTGCYQCEEYSVSAVLYELLLLLQNEEIGSTTDDRLQVLSLLPSLVRQESLSLECRVECFGLLLRWGSQEDLAIAVQLLREERDTKLVRAWLKEVTSAYYKPNRTLTSAALSTVQELHAMLGAHFTNREVAYEILRAVAKASPEPAYARLVIWDYCRHASNDLAVDDALWLSNFLAAGDESEITKLMPYARSSEHRLRLAALARLCVHAADKDGQMLLQEGLASGHVQVQRAILQGMDTAIKLGTVTPSLQEAYLRLLEGSSVHTQDQEVQVLFKRVWSQIRK